MTFQDKITLQSKNHFKVLAFKEGFFYKVYNEGAWFLRSKNFKMQQIGKSNSILNSIQNYMNPLVGIGLLLKGEKYFIGLSTPNMLNSKRYKEQEGLEPTATDKPHLYTTAGFDLKLNKDITISPSMLYRMVTDAPNQLTAIAKLSLKEKVSVGLGLSNNDYVSTMLQVKLNQIDLGFGYEIGQRTSSTALRANTSEILLRYRF